MEIFLLVDLMNKINALSDAELEIGTVESLSSTSDAYANITGEFPLQQLNLGLPRGSAGLPGAPGPPGPPGSGSATGLLFHVKSYGAVGDGAADDTAAVQAAANAASAFGGTVDLSGVQKTCYRITGPVVFGIAGLVGDSMVALTSPTTRSTIKCDSNTAAVIFGDHTSPKAPGAFVGNFNVDGNGKGDPAGIFRSEFNLSRNFRGIGVTNAAGKGVAINTTQNCTFSDIEIANCGDACLALDTGAGGNLFLRSEITGGRVCLEVKDDLAPGAHGGYPFGPTRNRFIHCLFEDYGTAGLGECIADFKSGQNNHFDSCAFSASAEAQSSGYLVRIRNGTEPTAPPVSIEAFFENCTFYGHNDTKAIYVGHYGRVVVTGHTSIGGCPSGFVTDSASTGYISSHMNFSGVTTPYELLPGGSWAFWNNEHSIGQAITVPVGSGSNYPLYIKQRGDAQYRAIIDKTGAYSIGDGTDPLPKTQLAYNSSYDALEILGQNHHQLLLRGLSVANRMIATAYGADAGSRWRLGPLGRQVWGNGSDNTTELAALSYLANYGLYAEKGLLVGGPLSKGATQIFSAATISVDATLAPITKILFAGGNVTTAFTITGGQDGQELDLEFILTGTAGTVTAWPADVAWIGGTPPIIGTLNTTTHVKLRRENAGSGMTWVEVSRAENVSNVAGGAGGKTSRVPVGGSTNQALLKASATSLDTAWTTLTKAMVGLTNVDDVSDANKPVSTLQLATLSGDQQAVYSAVFPSGAITLSSFTAATYTGYRLVLGGACTFSAAAKPTIAAGRAFEFFVELVQDATGSRTLTLNANVLKPAAIGAVTLSTAANAIDLLKFKWTGTELILTEFLKGIA